MPRTRKTQTAKTATAAPRRRRAAEKPAEADAPKEPVKRTSKLAGFTSRGQRYKHLTLPRDLHGALPDEGQRYDVSVEDGGVIVARPVAS